LDLKTKLINTHKIMNTDAENKNGEAMDFTRCYTPFWEDTRDVKFDSSCHFGKGTCFDGWESLREETNSPIGRFAVWKESGRNVWSAYGGELGYIAWHSFKTESEAKQWVVDLVNGV
jgi:hypothetical protein